MNYRVMGKFLSQILFVEAVFMVPALLISVYDADVNAIFGFLCSIGIILTASVALHFLCKKARKKEHLD